MGGTLNCESPLEKKRGEVGRELEKLQSATESLGEILTVLVTRLESVLTPATPANLPEKAEAKSLVSLATTIEKQTEKILNEVDFVSKLTDRIEL